MYQKGRDALRLSSVLKTPKGRPFGRRFGVFNFQTRNTSGVSLLRSLISTSLCRRAVLVIAVLLVPGVVLFSAFNPSHIAHAEPSKTLNFQARLKSNTGAVIPDGYYNIEFKIYNVSTGGSALWTDTRYDTNGVTAGNDFRIRVVNGYFSVNLGDTTAGGTAFSGINWDQQNWLTMNIGGYTQTASPTWDGEMTPRISLTAVPLAFVANNVNSGSTQTASTNSNAVSIQSGNATGATSNSGNISIDAGTASDTTGTISLGATNASGLILGRSGLTTTNAGALTVGGNVTIGNGVTNASPVGYILQATGGLGTDVAGAAFTLAGGRGTGTGVGGNIVFQYAPAGSSGSGLNALQTACSISGTNGTFSCPGSGGASERFGDASSVSTYTYALAVGSNATVVASYGTAVGAYASAANNSVALGNQANASGSSSVSIGGNSSSGTDSVAIGGSTVAAAGNNVAIGISANAAGANSVALGSGSYAGVQATSLGYGTNASYQGSIAIGRGAVTTATNQLVIGASAVAVNDVYLGSGVVDTAPTNVALQATGGSGTNIAGGAFTLAGGKGTGNANGGNLLFQTAKAGSSGSGLNSLQTVLTLSGTNGSALFKNSINSTTAFQIQDSSANVLINADTTNGRLGVGIATPLAKLHVVNDVAANDGLLVVQKVESATTFMRGIREVVDQYYFSTSQQTADGGYIAITTTNSVLAIVKMDSSGAVTWSKAYSNADLVEFNKIKQTADGGYIIAGLTYNSPVGRGILVKLDSSGTVTWSNTYDDGGYALFTDVMEIAGGGYIVSGSTDGLTKGLLVKYNSSGTVTWSKSFIRSSDQTQFNSVKQTADGGYIAAGQVASPVGYQVEGLIVKYDSSGTVTWSKNYMKNRDMFATSKFFDVSQTADGGYVVIGNNESGGVNGSDVIKYDSSGTVTWSHQFKNSSQSVRQTVDGGYIVATGDGFTKLTSTGSYSWAKTVLGSSISEIFQTADGGYFAVGFGADTDNSGLIIKYDSNAEVYGCGDYCGIGVDDVDTASYSLTAGSITGTAGTVSPTTSTITLTTTTETTTTKTYHAEIINAQKNAVRVFSNQGANAIFQVNGAAQFQNTTNSSAAFSIQDTAGASVLNVDTNKAAVTLSVVSGSSQPTITNIAAGSNSVGNMSGWNDYYFRVSAIMPNGGESAASPIVKIDHDTFTSTAAPTAVTATAGAAGPLTGTYTYRITYVDINHGETTGGTISSSVSPSSQEVDLTGIPIGPDGILNRRIYRTKAGGVDGTQRLVAEIDNTVTTYTDTTPDNALGRNMPTANNAKTATNSAVITFTPVAGAVSYRVYKLNSTTDYYGEYMTASSSPFTYDGSSYRTDIIPVSSSFDRLGVGTSSPLANIDVNGTVRIKATSSIGNVLNIQNNDGLNIFAVNTETNGVQIGGTLNSSSALSIQNSTGSSLLSADTNQMSIAIGSTYNSSTLFTSTVGVSPTDTNPYSTLPEDAVDFNNDGQLDLVGYNITTSEVEIWLRNSATTYGTGETHTTGGIDLNAAIAYGDVTNDGFKDIVMCNDLDATVSVYINNGSGSFANKVDYATNNCTNFGGTDKLQVIDLNNDGYGDIVVSDGSTDTVSVLINNGDGTFATKVDYATPSGAGIANSMVVKLNGDAYPDIVVEADWASITTSVFINNGDGTFATRVDYSSGQSYLGNMHTGDFNGDGKADLVYDGGYDTTAILINSGTGTFTSPIVFSGSGAQIGDFNGDGKLDVVNSYTGSIFLLAGDGAGAFTRTKAGLLGSTGAFNKMQDVNGDGLPDLYKNNNNDSSYYINNGDGTFKIFEEYNISSDTFLLLDFNGDGKLDNIGADNVTYETIGLRMNNFTIVQPTRLTVTANGNGVGQIIQLAKNTTSDALQIKDGAGGSLLKVDSSGSLLLGNTSGNGTFATKTDYTTGTTPLEPRSADFNGDGAKDIALINYVSATLSIFMNNGDGTFATKVDYSTVADPILLAIGDFNGDSKMDAVVANSTAGTFSIFMNNGDGTFATKVDYTAGDSSSSIVAADFNGDHKDDIAIGDVTEKTLSIYLNNGSGVFGAKLSYGFSDVPSTLVVADLNNDNKIDILADYTNSSTVPLLNDGTGKFSPVYGAGIEASGRIAVGDFNNDGKVDVVGYNGTKTTVSLNRGDATFTNTSYPATDSELTQFAVGDFNNDGALDVATVGDAFGGQTNVYVYYNTGSDGTLNNYVKYTVATGGQIIAGDFKRDGFSDIAVTDYATDTLSVLLHSVNVMPAGSIQLSGKYLQKANIDSTTAFDVQNSSGTSLFTLDSINNKLSVATDIVAKGSATATTGTTSGTGGSNVTSITLASAGSFANNDVIFVDNTGGSGQDYYTRIVSGAGTTTLTVSPAVSYGTGAGYTGNATITKYNVQSIGVTNNDYTTLNNRFFQGYFLGGIVTGAGSTTYSDQRVASTGTLNINAIGVNVQNSANSTTAFQVQNAAGSLAVLAVDTTNSTVNLGAGVSLSVTGGNTASRPGSPTEGMVYFDTTTKQLLTYANGKWQADRSTSTKIVAASNASQALKDGADYVLTGTSDQTIINTALTAAAGGTVYLTEGTYSVSGAISIPASTRFTGAGAGTLIQLTSGLTSSFAAISSSAARIAISNMRIDGNKAGISSGSQVGLSLSGGSGSGATAVPGATLTNLIIENFRSFSLDLTGANTSLTNSIVQNNNDNLRVLDLSYGMFTGNTFANNLVQLHSTSTYNTFTGNTFQLSGLNFINSASYNTVAGNTFNASSLGTSTPYNTFTGNTILNATSGGINISGDTVVSNNIISSNTGGYDGIRASGPRNVISSNVLSGNNAYGIRLLGGATHNSIRNNDITGNSNGGILLDNYGSSNGDTYNIISGNKIHDNGGDGIYVDSFYDTNTITGNTITDTTGTSYAINIVAGSNNNYIANNDYSGAGASSISDAGTGTRYASQLTSATILQSGSSLIKANATSVLTGSIDPAASTTVPGVGTKFTTELQVGDRITVSGETRTVTAIASDTSLTVDTAFSNNANDTSPDRLPLALRVTNSAGTSNLTVNDSGTVSIATGSASTTALIVQGSTSQSANLAQFNDVNGALLSSVQSDGTFCASTAAASICGGTYSLYGATGFTTVQSSGNISTQISQTTTFVQFSAGASGNYGGVGILGPTGGANLANNSLTVRASTSQTGKIFEVQNVSNVPVFSIATAGAVLFQNSTDSTAAFLIKSNTTADTLFTADTTNNKLVVGNATGTNANTTLLVLDNASADPATGYNGASYYNTTTFKFRCYENGAWVDCLKTQQTAYDAGNTITTTNARDLTVNLANTATDSNYVINVATGANSSFIVKDNGADFVGANVNAGARQLTVTTSDSYGFLVQDASSGDIFRVDGGAQTVYVQGTGGLQVWNTLSTGTASIAGNLIIADGSNSSITLKSATQVAATNYDITFPAITANDTVCLQTFANCGGGSGVSSLAAIGSVPNANGGSISGSVLTLQPADSTYGGVVSATTQSFAGAKTFNGSLTVGSAAGSTAVLTVNGATVKTTKVVSDDVDGGVLGGGLAASASVDIYSSISINQTTAGQAITLPTPTANTTYGRTILISNVGSVSFTLAGRYLGIGKSMTVIWSNTTGGASWQPIGGGRGNTQVTVAANLASTAVKEAAEYVANGEDSVGTGINTLDGDQIEINNALSAVSAAGGGTVYLTEGTFTIDAAISIPDNVTLAGSGMSTLIQLGNFGATSTSFTAIGNANVTTGTNVAVRDFKLDGRRATNTLGTQRGIYFQNIGSGTGASAVTGTKISGVYVTSFRNENVYIRNSSNNIISGITSQNSGSEGLYLDAASNNNTVTGSLMLGNTADGIILSTSNNNTISGNTTQGNQNGIYIDTSNYNTITGNTAQGNSSTGIVLGSATGNTVSGNTTQGNSEGIFISSSNHNDVTGNILIGNTSHGVNFNNANYNNFSSNKIHDSGGATANDGIYIGQSFSNSFVGNNITDSSCTSTCYAINITTSIAQLNYLADNTYIVTQGSDQARINDLGTNTRYASEMTPAAILQSGSSLIKANATTVLTGSIDPIASTTLTGVGTKFLTELQVGDRITVSAETRTITAIASDTSLTVDVATTNTANDTSVDRLPAALRVTDSTGVSKLLVKDNGNVEITSTSPDSASGAALLVSATATSVTNNQTGINGIITASPGSASSKAYTGTAGYAQSSSSNLTSGKLYGLYGGAEYSGTGTLAQGWAAYLERNNLSTGTISSSVGLSVANAVNSGGGVLTYNTGIYIAEQTGGATGTVNLLIGSATPPNGSWNIYSDSTDNNALAGNLRVGSTTAPTVALDVTGSAKIQTTSNSATAFQIQNSNASNVVNVDTTGANANNLITTLTASGTPSFENASTTGWTTSTGCTLSAVTSATTVPFNGQYSGQCANTATTGAGFRYVTGALTASTVYTLNFYAKVSATTGNFLSFGHRENGGAEDLAGLSLTTQSVTTSGWTRYSLTFKTGATLAGTDYLYIKQSDATARSLWIDGVTFQTDANADTNYREGKVEIGGIVDSSLILQNASNSTTAFQVQNASGIAVLTVDTTDTNLIQNPGGEVNASGWTAKGTGTIIRDTTQQKYGSASFKITGAAANDGAAYTFPTSLPVGTYSIGVSVKILGNAFPVNTLVFGLTNGSGDNNCTTITPGVTTLVPSTTGWTRFQSLSCVIATTAATAFYVKQTDATSHAGANNYWIDGVEIDSGAVATPHAAGSISFNGVVKTPFTLQNQSDSTSAFLLNNAAGTALISADTLNGSVTIGATNGTGTLTFGSSNAAQSINIGVGLGTSTIAIASGSSGNVITIGNFQTAGSFSVGNAMTSGTISIAGGSAVRTGDIVIGSTGTTSGRLRLFGGTGTGAFGGATSGIDILAGTAGTINIGANATNGTGAITIGSSTASYTLNLGLGVTAAASTKTINIGTSQNASTGVTAINIGLNNTSTGVNTITLKAGGSGASRGVDMTLGPATTTSAICSSLTAGANPVAGTAYQITDCAAAPTADYAEMYPVAGDVDYGDVVAVGSQLVNTYDISQDNTTDWSSVLGQITQLVKSSTSYQHNVIGVVSKNMGDFSSTGYNIKQEDNPMPVALSGRIPVKIATDSEFIQPGDYVTTSSTQPGRATKATHAGQVIGKALGAWIPNSGQEKVIIYVEQGYYNGPDSTAPLQNGDDANIANLNVSGLATLNNLNVSGATTLNDLTVSGSTTLAHVTVTGIATVAELHVTGDIVADGNLTVAGIITTDKLVVSTDAKVQHLTLLTGVVLGDASEDPTVSEVAHPISKRFKASKALLAGDVVVLDVNAGNGWVTTTPTAGSKLVIGIALGAAQNPGDTIEVAIGGTVKVTVAGTPNIGDLIRSDASEGKASTIAAPAPGELIGKVIGTVDINHQVLILVTLQ